MAETLHPDAPIFFETLADAVHITPLDAIHEFSEIEDLTDKHQVDTFLDLAGGKTP